MILFSDIFDRAIHLTDDPDLNYYYMRDPVGFQKAMLPYLLNGKDRFSSPIEVASHLVNYSSLESAVDELTGTGSNIVAVDEDFNPPADSVFTFRIGNDLDPDAVYNSETRTVEFSQDVPAGETCSVEYCYAGAFTDNFVWSYQARYLSSKVINERVIDILAHCTLLGWVEKEKNFVLDIRNLLTDHDFKTYAQSNSVRAKVGWFDNVKAELDDLIGKLGWDMRGTRKGGF